ncbi:MAG: prepilin-type N-terminal cleavage/methylation domain-containing protein [bacterium]
MPELNRYLQRKVLHTSKRGGKNIKTKIIGQLVTRSDRGFSILEMVVAITILSVVTSLLYLYNNKGFLFFDKIFTFDRIQLNSKSATELLLNNLREASQEYIYIGSGFNSSIPLPNDLVNGSEYIYFAKFISDKENSEVQGIKDSINRKTNGHYDYYLAYQAQIENGRGSYYEDRARLRTIIFPDQTIDHTDFNQEDWPFLPEVSEEDRKKIKNFGFLDFLKLSGNSDVFSLKNSVIDFNYLDGSQLLDKKTVLINIKMTDSKQSVILESSSAVVPRN